MNFIPARRPAGSPPAIWAAFTAQNAWKNWVLIFQLAVIGLLLLANMELAHRPPDVVLVGPEGKGTYVPHTLAGDALARFVADQRAQPSDVTLMHFTEQFARHFFAINSTTIDEAWPAALAMMTEPLRERMTREGVELLNTYRIAQVRMSLTIEEASLVERTGDLAQVRLVLSRGKQSLTDSKAPLTVDRLRVDLVEKTVPRTPKHPDGLQVADIRVEALPNEENHK